MKIISARDFRENQSKYLGFVDKGESVILQVRGGNYKIMPVSNERATVVLSSNLALQALNILS